MKPVIFSGTTEGRALSEALSAKHISHIVCVATEYGRLVMHRDSFADIREGRLDKAAMNAASYSMLLILMQISYQPTYPQPAKRPEQNMSAYTDLRYRLMILTGSDILITLKAALRRLQKPKAIFS